MFWSASLDVLFWGLKISPVAWTSFAEARISKLQFLIEKYHILFLALIFYKFLVIKTLAPDTEPDPGWYLA